MNALRILRGLAASACLAAGLAAHAQGLEAEAMKRYGGTYAADAEAPAQYAGR